MGGRMLAFARVVAIRPGAATGLRNFPIEARNARTPEITRDVPGLDLPQENMKDALVVIPHDELSPTFGLPECLRVPVSAVSIDALMTFVGEVHSSIQDAKGAIVAMKVRAFNRGFPQQPIAR